MTATSFLRIISNSQLPKIIDDFSIVFRLGLNGRLRYATNQNLTRISKHCARLSAVLIFPKDEKEVDRILNKLQGLGRDIIFILLSPIPERLHTLYMVLEKYAIKYQGNNNKLARTYREKQQHIIDVLWRDIIITSSARVYYDNNLSIVSWGDLVGYLKQIAMGVHPYIYDFNPALRYYDLLDTHYHKYALYGINQDKKCSILTPDSLFVESAPITKIKNDIDKFIGHEIEKNGFVSINKIIENLNGYGYLYSNLTAMILGYILRDYIGGYYYRDPIGNESLLGEHSLASAIKYSLESGRKHTISDFYIVSKQPHENKFYHYSRIIWDIREEVTTLYSLERSIIKKIREIEYPVCFMDDAVINSYLLFLGDEGGSKYRMMINICEMIEEIDIDCLSKIVNRGFCRARFLESYADGEKILTHLRTKYSYLWDKELYIDIIESMTAPEYDFQKTLFANLA